jgi:hypothetical protein
LWGGDSSPQPPFQAATHSTFESTPLRSPKFAALFLALAASANAQQPSPAISVPRVIRFSATLPGPPPAGSIGIGAGTQSLQLPGRLSGLDNNIIIGAFPTAPLGEAGHSQGATVIGGTQQNKVFIAGIRSIQTGNSDAVPVVIDSNGQLGTINASSPRHLPLQTGLPGRLETH